jgi:hypothetical protein
VDVTVTEGVGAACVPVAFAGPWRWLSWGASVEGRVSGELGGVSGGVSGWWMSWR